MQQPLSDEISRFLKDLESNYPMRRVTAAQELGKLSLADDRIIAALKSTAVHDDNPEVRQECLTALLALTPNAGQVGQTVETSQSSKARFAMSDDFVYKWQTILGSLQGWEPSGSAPSPKALALWAKLEPPFDPSKEPVIFRTALDPRPFNRAVFRVTCVTIQGTRFRTEPRGFVPSIPMLRATNSRLIASNTDNGKCLQLFYHEIASVGVDDDRYTLGLKDGTQVPIETKIPRPSLLGVLAVMGAPPSGKGFVAAIENAKVEDAQTFVAAFSGFFREIIMDNNRRSAHRVT